MSHAREKGSAWLTLVLILVAVLFYVFFSAAYSGGDVARPRAPTPQQLAEQRRERQLQAEAVAAMQQMVADGGVYSVDRQGHSIRVDPMAWGLLTIEQKQGLITIASRYFEAETDYGQVKVLSSRNDTVLGEYSAWSGIKVHQ